MNFRVGQKVVFVEGSNWSAHDACGMHRLERNAVYQVRRVYDRCPSGRLGLYLVGVINPRNEDGIERGYAAIDFRPAVEPDISVFTAILTKKQHENQIAARIPRKRPVKEDA